MSETPAAGDDTDGEQPRSADASLRQLLSTADTTLLAAVVERFWEDRGYRTTRTTRGSHRFVLVRDPAGEPVHVVWLDPTAEATPAHVARLDSMAASFGDAEATLATGRDYDEAVYTAADEHGIECLADEQLVTLVTRAELREVVQAHVASMQQNAVADGGATGASASAFELEPPADHPLAVRAGLVLGGTVLSLMAVWGGAAEITARLQACTGGCTLLWGASFLPLLVMLAGSFAVAVGVFD
ncbi:hypothetical protein [Salinigranum halophilum]|jgi:hypothetical protein|uniref:hypothetical protein n=1 Tax=Salinigranum halophilum TaxID=2565931 RepID=UPI0010A88D8F|nr:hypothetical protein [Salinigranum halophilum]